MQNKSNEGEFRQIHFTLVHGIILALRPKMEFKTIVF